MTNNASRPAIRFLSDNVPRSWTCGQRVAFGVVVQNAGTAPWRAEASDGRIHYLVAFVDGVVRGHALLPRSTVGPGERVALFLSLLAPSLPGRSSLTLDMAEHDIAYFRERGSKAFSVDVDVAPSPRKPRLAMRLHSRAFDLTHREWPLLAARASWRAHRTAFRLMPRGSRPRRWILGRWKPLNKRLSFLEQKARTPSPVSLPFHLVLDTTGRCNIRCPACFREALGFDLNHEPDMPAAVLERAIDDLFPTADSVNVTVIGEPFLTPHWEQLLEALQEYRVGLQLTTNGTVLNRKQFAEKVAPVLRHLEVSFDSASPALFERLRKGARFEQVLANTRAIGEIRRAQPEPKFHFGLSVTLFQQNVAELPDLIRLASELGGNRLRATFGVVFREDLSELSILRCPEAYNAVHPRALEAARECGVQVSLPAPFAESAQPDAGEKGFCRFLYEGLRVDRRGRITACLISNTPLASDYAGHSLRSHWNGPGMRQLRLLHDTPAAHPSCRDCYVVNSQQETVEARARQLLRIGPLTA
jgi:MoaA/NifB/PqqE/SkfB family radical SAM enzyme